MEKHGAQRGYMDPSLASKTLDRAWPANTEARKLLRSVADSSDTSWIIYDNEVQIVANQQGMPGAPAINSNTGMIGIPEQQLSGIVVRVLMNPHYRLQQMVHIDSALINAFLSIGGFFGPTAGGPMSTFTDNKGNPTDRNLQFPGDTKGGAVIPGIAPDSNYRIVRIDHDGTMRDQPWYTTLTCLQPGTVSSSGLSAEPKGDNSGRSVPEKDDAKSGSGGGGE
jgi:hypothetical protein